MADWRLAHLSHPTILIVRNDGLGDFVVTLPLVASLKRQVPAARVFVLVSAAVAELVPLLPDIEGAIVDRGLLLKRHRKAFTAIEGRQGRRMGRHRLQADIESHGFDLAILPYAEAASAALIHRAGIPLRAGSLRRHFFWRFNLFNRESRRASPDPEWALNLGYLELLGLRREFAFPRFQLGPAVPAAPPRPYVVIHPHKRSGTALAWPGENFLAMAREAMEDGDEVVVIGDPQDGPVLTRLFSVLPEARILTGLSLPQLARVIAGARYFLGNSSGPLHLAALAGTPHVGLYPQNRVDAPARWRTLPSEGSPAEFREYLLAPQFPKNCVKCERERCPYFNCVASITAEEVRGALRSWGNLPKRVGGNAPIRASGG